MPRVNIYLSDDLAEEGRTAWINVSQVAQEALRKQLRRRRRSDWAARVRKRPATGVTHEQMIDALRAAREEMGARGG